MPRPRSLLWCGVVGAVAFVLVFLVNDAFKPNYEPVRDFVSEAAIGPGGWVQIVNFLSAGALLTASSFALRRTVGRSVGWLVRILGVGLMVAGAFVSDPAPHDEATWHGTAHNIVSVIVFVALSLACFTAARWRPTPAWRWYCVLTGAAVPVLFVIAGGVSETAGLWQRLTIVVGWAWLAALGMRALRSLDRSAER
ncbi:DUF998 domain-containing protein [Micromonospora arborensis]|uniref:DUF998 domain-containing protein n=1 Tax=Micromonospora arborensis TaxID=2116518 RepID=A0A318NQB8_9ACTN|nr:DUF998 domain-containing protein [Micromonospora arborensis]